jgi:hypothetical protein
LCSWWVIRPATIQYYDQSILLSNRRASPLPQPQQRGPEKSAEQESHLGKPVPLARQRRRGRHRNQGDAKEMKPQPATSPPLSSAPSSSPSPRLSLPSSTSVSFEGRNATTSDQTTRNSRGRDDLDARHGGGYLETVLSLIAEDAVFLLLNQPSMRDEKLSGRPFGSWTSPERRQARYSGDSCHWRLRLLRESAFSDDDSNSLVRRCQSYGERRAGAGFSFAMPTCLERLGAPVLDSRTEPHSIMITIRRSSTA